MAKANPNHKKEDVIMTNQSIYLTKRGIKELKKAIIKLEREQASVRERLRTLDKTDNHDMRLARIELLSQLEAVESELVLKKTTLKHVTQLPRKRDALKVALGSVVDLIDQKGRQVRYQIVDTLEANPSDGRISIKSPLGRELIGRRMHESIEWTHGLKTAKFQLVSIR